MHCDRWYIHLCHNTLRFFWGGGKSWSIDQWECSFCRDFLEIQHFTVSNCVCVYRLRVVIYSGHFCLDHLLNVSWVFIPCICLIKFFGKCILFLKRHLLHGFSAEPSVHTKHHSTGTKEDQWGCYIYLKKSPDLEKFKKYTSTAYCFFKISFLSSCFLWKLHTERGIIGTCATTRLLYIVHCTLYSVHCTVYTHHS